MSEPKLLTRRGFVARAAAAGAALAAPVPASASAETHVLTA
jgi:hypothetical protein